MRGHEGVDRHAGFPQEIIDQGDGGSLGTPVCIDELFGPIPPRNVEDAVHVPMAATLDGRVAATEAVFEAKFMLPWAFSEEAAAEKHMAQLQHNMWVVAARSAVLSVITGGR